LPSFFVERDGSRAVIAGADARHLARSRAGPVGDLALRKAIEHFYGETDERAAGARFDPFHNLSAHYLLAGLYAGVGS